MAYETGTATDLLDLRRKLNNFLCGYPTQGAVTYTGTGNGTLGANVPTYFVQGSLGQPAAVSETWTIKCITAAAGGGTFSVVGSVSGAKPNATVGTAYDNGLIKFTLTAGTTDFVVNDQFQFTLTRGAMKTAGQEWQYLGVTADGSYMLKGLGLTRSESIYVMNNHYSSVGTDVYNLWFAGSLGYSSYQQWNTQPGASASRAVMLCWNSAMPYWFVANGQRFIIVTKVSTTYRAFYGGKFLPYSMPNEYGYPVYIGGEHNDVTTRWSSTSGDIKHFNEGSKYGTRVCLPDGAWYDIGNFSANSQNGNGRFIWPYSGGTTYPSAASRLSTLRNNIDGSYTLLPLIAGSAIPTSQLLGELDGAYYVSGYNNAAENTITVDGKTYLVVQNVFRTGITDYWALCLE